MDFTTARDILELPVQFSEKQLRRQYHRLILKYHPDKNSDASAAERFRAVKDAYTWLNEYLEFAPDNNHESYEDTLLSLLRMVLTAESKESLFVHISQVLSAGHNVRGVLEHLPSAVLLRCYSFVMKYRDILCIPSEVLKSFEELVHLYRADDPACVSIIRPSLDDILQSNVSRVEIEGDAYFVPMWHSEVTFDRSHGELLVRCVPDLPGHISIDCDNNIHCHVRTSIALLLNKQGVDVSIGEILLYISAHKLRVTRFQTWSFRAQGMPTINDRDMYDDSAKGDIIVHLELY